jgi:hypothetical protein
VGGVNEFVPTILTKVYTERVALKNCPKLCDIIHLRPLILFPNLDSKFLL